MHEVNKANLLLLFMHTTPKKIAGNTRDAICTVLFSYIQFSP